jgi:vesicle-associated membrane protein 4
MAKDKKGGKSDDGSGMPPAYDKSIPKVAPVTTEKMTDIKHKVEDTKEVMERNIQDAMERGERFEDLGAKTETLAATSKAFGKHAKKVKKNLWLKNMKMTIILTLIVLLMVGGVAAYVITQFS